MHLIFDEQQCIDNSDIIILMYGFKHPGPQLKHDRKNHVRPFHDETNDCIKSFKQLLQKLTRRVFSRSGFDCGLVSPPSRFVIPNNPGLSSTCVVETPPSPNSRRSWANRCMNTFGSTDCKSLMSTRGASASPCCTPLGLKVKGKHKEYTNKRNILENYRTNKSNNNTCVC